MVPDAAVEIKPNDLVTQGVYEQKVYLFDWDRYKLADGVSIDDNDFTLTLVKPKNGTATLASDNESILAGSRKVWLRLSGGERGDVYRVSSRVVTNEDPAQAFELSFLLLIEG